MGGRDHMIERVFSTYKTTGPELNSVSGQFKLATNLLPNLVHLCLKIITDTVGGAFKGMKEYIGSSNKESILAIFYCIFDNFLRKDEKSQNLHKAAYPLTVYAPFSFSGC